MAPRAILYPNEISRILTMPGGPVGVAVRSICLDIAKEGEVQARKKLGNRHPSDSPRTGRYAKSFAVRVKRVPVTGFEFIVENTAKYAAIIEGGSKPHEIRARRAKYLVFRSRQTGQVVRRKVVFHPGTKPERILWIATEVAVRRRLNR
jgi:hypothetical protein